MKHFRSRREQGVRCLGALCLAVFFAAGCASVPHGRRGVGALAIRGMHRMDPYALEVCLATRERGSLAIDVSTNPSPICNQAPFDAGHLRWSIISWPWSAWPVYDRVVFERDVERIGRWYRARGFYDAQVLATHVEPATDPTGAGQGAEIEVTVTEGEPVLVGEVRVEGTAGLAADLRAQVTSAVVLRHGQRFDEVLYEQGKQTIARELREASYARAKVHGRVSVDPAHHLATVVYTVEPGARCRFGDLAIYIDDPGVPGGPVVAAAGIERGQPFSQSAIDEADRAVYALGAFSSVEVVPDLESDVDDTEIDVVIRARTGALARRGIGLGMQIGTATQLDAATAAATTGEVFPQWDLHVLGIYEDRNFLSGLRRLRLELRPRLIFNGAFPAVENDPFPGLLASAELRQPGFLEARTNLRIAARYDLGPDPYGRPFIRQIADASIGPERTFFKNALYASVALHVLGSLPLELPRGAATQPVPIDQSTYVIFFLEQTLRIDLRDSPTSPRSGLFFQVGLQESPIEGGWQYIRATPDVRAYVPLPLGLVIAARFALGVEEILWHDPSLPETLPPGTSTTTPDGPGPGLLGPDPYRLRGGGANSDRGYLPGQLGGPALRDLPPPRDVVVPPPAPMGTTRPPTVEEIAAQRAAYATLGGVRRWEASLELRIPFSRDFGIVLFLDAGDVSPTREFRFYALGLSAGIGLRYRTVVGPIRLDLGLRIPTAQCVDAHPSSCPATAVEQNLALFTIPGALHITLGEAF